MQVCFQILKAASLVLISLFSKNVHLLRLHRRCTARDHFREPRFILFFVFKISFLQGMIPLGDPFVLHPSVGPTSYNWIADVPEGTSITFAMIDSHGRSGGSSDLKFVGDSDDSSCINSSSPTSTVNTNDLSTSGPSPSQQPSSTSRSSLSSGAIAGIVIGVILGLLLAVLLVWYWKHRKARAEPSRLPEADSSDPHHRHLSIFRRTRHLRPVDLLHGHVMSYAASSSLSLPRPGPPKSPTPEVSPFVLNSSDSAPGRLLTPSASERADISHIDDEEQQVLVAPSDPTETARRSSVSTSRVSEKTGTLASSRNATSLPRLIVHNDIEDVEGDGDGSYIELPPVYSENRSSRLTTDAQPH